MTLNYLKRCFVEAIKAETSSKGAGHCERRQPARFGQRNGRLDDRFRETELMDLPFAFPWNRIYAISEFWETKSKARSGRIGKRTAAEEARNKVRRTTLKSHEIREIVDFAP